MALIDRRRGPTPSAASGRCSRLGQGLSNRLIARRLGIAEKTVKAHVTSISTHIGVTDRVQAALVARQRS